LRATNITGQGLIFPSLVFVPTTYIAAEQLLRRGDIVIASSSGSKEVVGKAGQFWGAEHELSFGAFCTVLRPENTIEFRYFGYYFQTANYRTLISDISAGSNINNIKSSELATHLVPIAPLAEQTRIVEKLEELLSDLDAGVAELKVAQKKLKQYRQSLLKAAVEGALTADWRAERVRRGEVSESGEQLLARILTERRARWEAKQLAKFKAQNKTPPQGWKDKYPEPVQLDASELPELPKGWVWASVDQCALDESAITDGPFGSNLKTSHYQEAGPRVIRLKNIGDGVFVDAHAHIAHSHYARLKKHAVEENDLVVAMLGEVLPRACIVPAGVSPAIVKADCARIRLNQEVLNPSLLNAQLNAQPTRDRVVGLVKGIGRPRINLGHIRAIPVALCAKDEQMAIKLALFEAEQSANQLFVEIELALKKSATQRKNILKAAFSGQLVPQDPNDEPASVLLERIRAERAARESTAPKRGRKIKDVA